MYMPILPVSVKTMRYTGSPNIDFYYPVVFGLKDPAIEEKINNQITGLMYKLIGELQHPGVTVNITGSYEIKANQRNVLSISLSAMGDFGGAHPTTYIRALNIDVATGNLYTLHAQFEKNSDYVRRLSDIIKAQIKERDIPISGEFQGIKAEPDYYIADNVLVIFFQLYEIAPYAAGFPYFPIPLYSIEDILAEGSLLKRMTYIV